MINRSLLKSVETDRVFINMCCFLWQRALVRESPNQTACFVGSPEMHVNARCKWPICSGHFFLSISYLFPFSSHFLLLVCTLPPSFSLCFSICDVESGPYLMCSSFSISISRQVASGAMLEPARPTPPIYLPCATPRMATCLWMVAMLTMSQVRF